MHILSGIILSERGSVMDENRNIYMDSEIIDEKSEEEEISKIIVSNIPDLSIKKDDSKKS